MIHRLDHAGGSYTRCGIAAGKMAKTDEVLEFPPHLQAMKGLT